MIAGWLPEALAGSALLMALVLALRVPVRHAFGAQVAYLLWLLPLARLLVPPSALPSLWPEAVAPLQSPATNIVALTAAIGSAPSPADAPASTGTMVFALWIAGVAAVLLWQLLRYIALRRRLLAGATECAAQGRVRVLIGAGDAGPLAIGMITPAILLPRDFALRYSPAEQQLALAHERAHHDRGDLFANAIALGMLALQWFNPIAWLAMRAFRADQEMACDARVLAANPGLRPAYGAALAKAACGGVLSPASHLRTIDQLKGRLKMLNVEPKSTARRTLGMLLAGGLIAGSLVATATGTAAGAAIAQAGDNVRSALDAPPPPPPAPLTNIAVQAPPAPPAPPAALSAPRPPLPPLVSRPPIAAPNIDARTCTAGEGDGRQTTIESGTVDARRVVICTDRIEAEAQRAAAAGVDADEIARTAMQSALGGLEAARRSIVDSPDMRPADRAEALKDIDEAIREVRAEIADQG